MVKVGLITGGGVGLEVSSVFRRSLDFFSQSVEIVECKHYTRSFTELKNEKYEDIEAIVKEDVERLKEFYVEFYNKGGRCIFRCPVNAEPLYALRQELKAVKIAPLNINSRNILLIRDEMQGYYANDSWNVEEDRVAFSGSFTKANLKLVLSCARKEAVNILDSDHETWMVYKHHLFANRIEQWVKELGENITQHIYVAQPGTGNIKIMDYIENGSKDLLLIMGNEIGDILHEDLLGRVEGQSRETSIAINIYLSPEVYGLVEYQTVHGSADDVAGQDKFNPIATIRAAAAIIEKEDGKPGVINRLEDRIRKAIQEGYLTQRLEMKTNTRKLVDFILSK